MRKSRRCFSRQKARPRNSCFWLSARKKHMSEDGAQSSHRSSATIVCQRNGADEFPTVRGHLELHRALSLNSQREHRPRGARAGASWSSYGQSARRHCGLRVARRRSSLSFGGYLLGEIQVQVAAAIKTAYRPQGPQVSHLRTVSPALRSRRSSLPISLRIALQYVNLAIDTPA